MSFQDAYPELRSAPPTLTGEIAFPTTPLMALRRQQLADLARAYGITIPPNATKNEMLPSLITAEQQGIFKRPPLHPWYLQKAMRNSDDPVYPIPENPEIVQAPGDGGSASEPVLKKRKESGYHRKMRLLKEIGVEVPWACPKDEMERLAAEHGIS